MAPRSDQVTMANTTPISNRQDKNQNTQQRPVVYGQIGYGESIFDEKKIILGALFEKKIFEVFLSLGFPPLKPLTVFLLIARHRVPVDQF